MARIGVNRRGLAVGGIVGPVAFVTAWVVGGLITPGFSFVDDAISQLAASGAETQWLMTAGLVAFGVGVPLFGVALREVLPGPAGGFAIVCGAATLAVACLPIDVTSTVDGLHGVAAVIGYLAIALLPLVASFALCKTGHDLRGKVAAYVGLIAGMLLFLVPIPGINGLAQRAGLLVGDLWIVTTASAILRHRL